MIPGAATIEATESHAAKYPEFHFSRLGPTQWQVSQAGFGCYRVSAGIEAHFQAMEQALDRGINLIDTSTNYADGGSEQLVGQVLARMISNGRLAREAVVVVSKVGYLQGRNYALSQERKAQGRPFPDLVPYSKGLEHCIHPEFLEDQVNRSLERLGLETLDLLLLHNPEYYLGWAVKHRRPMDEAREIFYQRIHKAFEYLEKEVARGRIQGYGISSNTFPVFAGNEEFVSLDRVQELATQVSAGHHFHAIQLPMNLYESGAVLEKNQIDSQSVLETALDHKLGVLINRPLNAFSGNRLVRLAAVEKMGRYSDDAIIQAITRYNKSEKTLWRKLLPALNLPTPLYNRVKSQAAVGDQLKHHWRNFGHYERWRQFKDGLLLPHMHGVFDFLEQYAGQVEGLEPWLVSHQKGLDTVVKAVESLYAIDARRETDAIRLKVREADDAWDAEGTLSQLALRALRSTLGVHTVLVGMRDRRYVDDVVEELERPVPTADMNEAWWRLKASLSGF